MYFLKLVCGISYPYVYKTQREVQIFTSYSDIWSHCFENLYGLMVYFTTFCSIFNIFTYSNDWGGGAMWWKHTHLLIQ